MNTIGESAYLDRPVTLPEARAVVEDLFSHIALPGTHDIEAIAEEIRSDLRWRADYTLNYTRSTLDLIDLLKRHRCHNAD